MIIVINTMEDHSNKNIINNTQTDEIKGLYDIEVSKNDSKLLNQKRENFNMILDIDNSSNVINNNIFTINNDKYKINTILLNTTIEYGKNKLIYFDGDLPDDEKNMYNNDRLLFIFKFIREQKIKEENDIIKNTITVNKNSQKNILENFIYKYNNSLLNLKLYSKYNYFDNCQYYLNLYAKNIIFKKIIDGLFTLRNDKCTMTLCKIEYLAKLECNEIFILLEKIYKLSKVITINNDTMDFVIDNNIINKILSLSNNCLDQFNFLQIYYLYYQSSSPKEQYLEDLLLEFHLNNYNYNKNKNITLDYAKKINNNLYVDFFMINLILLQCNDRDEYFKSLDLFFNNKYSTFNAQAMIYYFYNDCGDILKIYKHITHNTLLSSESLKKIKKINSNIIEKSIKNKHNQN